MDHVIGHWTGLRLLILSSGTWYTVTDGNANFANSDRPDSRSGVGTSKPCVPGRSSTPALFMSYGDVSMKRDRTRILILRWRRSFLFGESLQLELRAEAFNALNHPNFLFAAPGRRTRNNATVFGTPSFASRPLHSHHD